MNIDYYYEMLGLKPGASEEEIKETYRDLVKVWHPDRFTHDPELQKKAEEKLKEINQAYQEIQDLLYNPYKYQNATKSADNEYTRAGETFQSDTKQSTGSSSREYRSTPFVQNIKAIAIGNILVTDNSFRYLNQQYSFNEIKHITFYWVTDAGFDPNGFKTEEASLEITLYNNQKLKESVGHHEFKIPFSKSSVKMGKKGETLAEACKLLYEKTFDRRFTYYANQLKTDGYFVYDDKFFFYDGRVVSEKGKYWEKGEFRVTDNPEIDRYTITLSIIKGGFFSLKNRYLIISLKTDKDVFLALFEILRKPRENAS